MCSADAMILLGQGKESVEKFREATLEVALLVREDIKKNCRKREIGIIYLTPPPSTERVKNKRMKY